MRFEKGILIERTQEETKCRTLKETEKYLEEQRKRKDIRIVNTGHDQRKEISNQFKVYVYADRIVSDSSRIKRILEGLNDYIKKGTASKSEILHAKKEQKEYQDYLNKIKETGELCFG